MIDKFSLGIHGRLCDPSYWVSGIRGRSEQSEAINNLPTIPILLGFFQSVVLCTVAILSKD